MPKYRVTVDENKCIGCGSCSAVCPANFEMTAGGKAKSIKQEIESMGCNQLAAESCPVEAIRIDPIVALPQRESNNG